MNKDSKTRIIIAVVGLIVVGGLWATFHNSKDSKVKHPRGTIVAVDPVKKTATVEILHTKTGQKIPFNGNVQDNCTILIDGKPATLADVRVGDAVELERVDKEIKAVRVKRTEAGSPESKPATRTAPAAGA